MYISFILCHSKKVDFPSRFLFLLKKINFCVFNISTDMRNTSNFLDFLAAHPSYFRYLNYKCFFSPGSDCRVPDYTQKLCAPRSLERSGRGELLHAATGRWRRLAWCRRVWPPRGTEGWPHVLPPPSSIGLVTKWLFGAGRLTINILWKNGLRIEKNIES